ncbi:hypothetical protein JTB14_030442 [Gonioctena quinquepunctata]|nr:hypothetical protein JTB14_030442 [Gonioctena quinquepunctata]
MCRLCKLSSDTVDNSYSQKGTPILESLENSMSAAFWIFRVVQHIRTLPVSRETQQHREKNEEIEEIPTYLLLPEDMSKEQQHDKDIRELTHAMKYPEDNSLPIEYSE